MFDALNRLLAPAAIERATLLANHVLASEPVASERLRAHAGKRVRVQIDELPGWLPALPQLSFAVTRAGLLEWQGESDEAELVLRVSAAQAPAIASQVLSGQKPPLAIEGDAALAADVGWLVENLRWDLTADLERVLPPPVVQQLVLVGRVLRSGLRSLLGTLRRGAPGA
jgi:ubiquinone biosynthesis accessory factor UbiJ